VVLSIRAHLIVAPVAIGSNGYPGTSKLGLERETGFEPRSVAGSALKPASPAPARGPAPSRLRYASVTPRRGHTPFETPGRGFKVTFTFE